MKALLVLIVAALTIGAWLLHETMRAAPVSGQVFAVKNPDSVPADWKVTPFAGATVLLLWRGELQNNPVDSSSVCLRALHLRSGPDGGFNVPEWGSGWRWPLITNVRGIAYVVEPGFASVRDKLKGSEAWMTTEKGLYVARRSLPTDLEALEYLEHETQRCERRE